MRSYVQLCVVFLAGGVVSNSRSSHLPLLQSPFAPNNQNKKGIKAYLSGFALCSSNSSSVEIEGF